MTQHRAPGPASHFTAHHRAPDALWLAVARGSWLGLSIFGVAWTAVMLLAGAVV